MMQFTDAITIKGTRRTADGYLVADARIARTGIQTYLGSEVGKPEMGIVRVYRPEGEVFKSDALVSMAHRPVTVNHPKDMVTADNWKSHAVGYTADEITRDGEFVRVPLMVADAAAIAAIEGGQKELSVGYTCDLAFEAGKTTDGQEYDAVQRNIRGNHVAIVRAGRAGSEVRIGDDAEAIKWGAAPITHHVADRKPEMENLRKVMVDGIPVETTEAGAAVIDRLQKDLAKASTQIADASATLDAERKAHADALAKVEAERDKLKAETITDAEIDKRVAARAALVDNARKIVKDFDPAGKPDAEIRKAVVTQIRGADAVAGKSDAWFDASFDLLLEATDKKSDPVAAALGSRQHTADASDEVAKARAQMIADTRNGWAAEAAGAAN